MKLVVVHNTNSGKNDSLNEIKLAFSAQGVEPIYLPIADINNELPQLVTTNPDLVVAAAGGDGTINSVAKHILGSSVTLAVIPVGTLNHFARELNIPLNIADAVKVAVQGNITQVDVGSVNDHIFLNNSSIGWYPRSLMTREELGNQIGKWPAALIGFVRAIAKPRRYFIELTVNGNQHTYRTPFVFVGNNAYKRGEPAIGQRETLQGGQLAIYIVKAQNFLGIIRMLAIGLFTKKQRTQDFSVHHATECIIHTKHHSSLHVACDGEVFRVPTPLHYQSRASSLRVLTP